MSSTAANPLIGISDDDAEEILSGEEESCARMVRRSLEDEGIRFLRGSRLDHAGRDNGESWVADGHPLAGGDIVKVTYKLRGEPFEIEIPVP